MPLRGQFTSVFWICSFKSKIICVFLFVLFHWLIVFVIFNRCKLQFSTSISRSLHHYPMSLTPLTSLASSVFASPHLSSHLLFPSLLFPLSQPTQLPSFPFPFGFLSFPPFPLSFPSPFSFLPIGDSQGLYLVLCSGVISDSAGCWGIKSGLAMCILSICCLFSIFRSVIRAYIPKVKQKLASSAFLLKMQSFQVSNPARSPV